MPFHSAKPQPDWNKEAEILGGEQTRMSAVDAANLSANEIERMREIVLAHDRDKSKNVFDLSKPPVVKYEHKKFPMMLYDHKNAEPPRDEIRPTPQGANDLVHVPAKIRTRMVHSEAELKSALDAGWKEKPPVFDAPDMDADEAMVMAAEARARKK